MITIISGTNRLDNKTIQLAQWYRHQLDSRGQEVRLLNLEELPEDILIASRHAAYDKAPGWLKVQENFLFPADRFLFILPEYNGSIPGILKLMIDAADIARAFYHKKACLTGLSSGRAGNLRGLDHLTNILHYLRMQVYYNKLPVSRIHTEMDQEGQMIHAGTQRAIADQIDGFLQF